MAEATDYQGPTRVGSHAYARAFVDGGARVMWIGTPIYPHNLLGSLRDGGRARRIAVWTRGGERSRDGVLEYYPLTFLPVVDRPLLRTLAVARSTLRATAPPLRSVLRVRGFDAPDVLWMSQSRFSFPISSMLPAKVRAYRLSDDWAHFRNIPPSLLALEESLIDSADAVFVTSRLLEEKVRGRRNDVVYLPNGVGDEFFVHGAPEPELLRRFPRPRVIYAGTVGEWLDWKAVVLAARRLPQASFVFVGPGAPRDHDLPTNVAFVGPQPHALIPAILNHCALGVIPFKKSALTDAVSPVKLYEYLAAGLPVVSSRLDEIGRSGAPVTLCDGAEAFAESCASALENAPTGRDERVSFAREHTWAKRFDVVRRTLRF